MKDILKAVVFAGLFAVPFLTLYVEDAYFFPYITGKNFWFRIIIDFTVVAWAIWALLDIKVRPRISGIVWGFSALLVVMFFANLLGEHPRSSFWSNFERMDGYVSLVHTFLYALVLGSVLQTKEHWRYLFGTSLFVAFIVATYGLAQHFGMVQGGGRIDSLLGNAAYMAVYMLFHVFIAFWLFVETKLPMYKVVLLLLAAMFTFVLFETGTRGTAVGLATGIFAMVAYIALFGRKYAELRKYAIGVFIILAIGVAGFVAGRDTEIVQNNQNLSRIANISLQDLTVRATIWGLAWEGVKERPVLGWGQSNFNYVFNKYYDPFLYDQEQWFDRSHNIFFDWLIAGGFLGLFAYLSIFLACAWYLFLRPLLHPEDESFTVLERGVLIGILVGYFTHNLVVFDNIVSYIFFAMVLGLIHSRVSQPIAALEKPNSEVDDDIVTQFALPVGAIAFVAVLWFVHLPGMAAASDIIDAFKTDNPEERLEHFKQAYERDTFAQQEITEQLTQQAIAIFRDPKLSEETKLAFAAYTEEQLQRLTAQKPGDARIHMFAASYYRSSNQLEKAAEQLALAREFSPLKQTTILQQALVELSRGNSDAAAEFAQYAFALNERNEEAREYYVAVLMYTGDLALAEKLFTDAGERGQERIAMSNFVASSANQNEQYEFMITLFKKRVELEPRTTQHWATLAYLEYKTGDETAAIAVLEEAADANPAFAPTAKCFIGNIEIGNEPQEGC